MPYNAYKEEIHNFNPRISLFLDVISAKEADEIRLLAEPQVFTLPNTLAIIAQLHTKCNHQVANILLNHTFRIN